MEQASLLNRIRQHRSFVRVIRSDLLAGLLESPCGDYRLRARIASEITARAWLLSGAQAFDEIPEYGLFVGAWEAYGLDEASRNCLSDFCRTQVDQRSYAMPQLPDSACPCFSSYLKELLSNWGSAAGVIPFVNRSKEGGLCACVALPFIVESADDGRAQVVTAHGHLLPGLCEGASRAAATLQQLRVIPTGRSIRVVMVTLDSDGLPMQGQSLGLPVVVAEYLRRNRSLRSLTICASGTLGPHGGLSLDRNDAEVLSIKDDFLRRIGFRVRIFPKCDSFVSNDRVRVWPAGESLEPHLAELSQLDFAEHERSETLSAWSSEEISTDLDRLSRDMSFSQVRPERALIRLRDVESVLSARRDVKSRYQMVQCQSLLASAFCHLGDTKASAEIVQSLLKQGAKIGSQVSAVAMLRQAVNFTDFADYEQAAAYADQAAGLVPYQADPVAQLELRLRAVSTKAQTLMFWGLINNSKREEALRLAEEAVEIAKELDGEGFSPGCRNVPRNLNYVLLHKALHAPHEAEPFYNLHRETLKSDRESMEYTQRILWQARYRQFLNGESPSYELDASMLPEHGWLRGLALKYRGAVLAHAGKVEEAVSDFEESRLHTDTMHPLIRFLGATAALQAGESLLSAHPVWAKKQLEYAHTVFSEMPAWFRTPALTTGEWMRRADGLLQGEEPEALPFPQRKYPY